MLKLGSTAFKIAAAGMMALSLVGCAQSASEPPPPPPVTSVQATQDAANFVAQFDGLPNGVYKITIDGRDFGVDGDVPCVAIRAYHRSHSAYSDYSVGGAALGLSCNWAAPIARVDNGARMAAPAPSIAPH